MKKIIFASMVVLASAMPGIANAQARGARVLSYYQNERSLYPAEVESVSGESVTLLWDDGTTSAVNRNALRPFNWRAGTPLSCKWEDGKYYPARISRIGGDMRTLDVIWTQENTTSRTKTSLCRSAG